MIPSTLFVLVAALSSLLAANGAVIERDGTFTFLTPQPTAPGQAASTTTSTTPTQSSTPTTSSMTSTASPSRTTTVTTPTTTSATVTQPTCPAASCIQCPSAVTVTVTVTAPASTCPPSKQVNCNGVVAWQRNFAYTAGNQVTFNGHLWTAVQWTFSNSPGDASGTWQDLGACA